MHWLRVQHMFSSVALTWGANMAAADVSAGAFGISPSGLRSLHLSGGVIAQHHYLKVGFDVI